MKSISKDRANKIYDLLVSISGARNEDRDSFVFHHTESNIICTEWRFQGKLGFGGKYRSERNEVDCYMEDLNENTRQVISELNQALKNIPLDLVNEFTENEWSHMSDCVFEVRHKTNQEKPTREELVEIFNSMSDKLKADAISWGMNDTVWRTDFIRWYSLNFNK